jgi:DNA-binding transcriptional ArsR family regulator
MCNILSETLFAILVNTTRLRSLLLLLQQGELCVCELTYVIGATQPNMSRHLAQLQEAGLVADRRQGQWIYYMSKSQRLGKNFFEYCRRCYHWSPVKGAFS